jgi:putative aminopeptidase FrvX
MKTESRNFLEQYLNNASPTGFESSGQKIWLEYIKPYIDKYITDIYGTVVGVINPDAGYKVVIEAHADEISWFVNYITKEGFIYLRRNGGSDHQIAPSKRVNIITKKGVVKAVFGWPAIHIRDKKNEETPKLENLFLDCGCSSREEVKKLGIEVGCVATFEDKLMELNNKYFVGRALDNRMGGFIIAEVARTLKENKKKLPFGLYIVNSVQEEIGLRGAAMIARRIKPDVAIITDVTHDTQAPMHKKESLGDISLNKGPALTYGSAVQNNLLEMIFSVANRKKIPVQKETSSTSTGTDTDAFAYAGEGSAAALISLPLRYMHTTVEMVSKKDIENVIKLIYEFLIQIKSGHDFRYIK